MRLRASFDSDKITDTDCVNISRKRFIVATVEDGTIKLYSISFENGSTQTPTALAYTLKANY